MVLSLFDSSIVNYKIAEAVGSRNKNDRIHRARVKLRVDVIRSLNNRKEDTLSK